MESVLTKLENEGYKTSKKKSKFYQRETVWLGHAISQGGVRPNKEETDAINKKKPTDKHKITEIISRSNTIFRKLYTEPIREDGQHEITNEKK